MTRVVRNEHGTNMQSALLARRRTVKLLILCMQTLSCENFGAFNAIPMEESMWNKEYIEHDEQNTIKFEIGEYFLIAGIAYAILIQFAYTSIIITKNMKNVPRIRRMAFESLQQPSF